METPHTFTLRGDSDLCSECGHTTDHSLHSNQYHIYEPTLEGPCGACGSLRRTDHCRPATHRLPVHDVADFGLNHLFMLDVRRAERWHPGGLGEWSPLEWAGAMCGEAGEAANAAKKLKRIEGGIKTFNSPERHYSEMKDARTAVAKEVADTIIYGLLLMAAIGIKNPCEVIREVFNQKSDDYGFPERV